MGRQKLASFATIHRVNVLFLSYLKARPTEGYRLYGMVLTSIKRFSLFFIRDLNICDYVRHSFIMKLEIINMTNKSCYRNLIKFRRKFTIKKDTSKNSDMLTVLSNTALRNIKC